MTISRAQMKDRSFYPYMKAESDVIVTLINIKMKLSFLTEQGCQLAVSGLLFIDIFAFFA